MKKAKKPKSFTSWDDSLRTGTVASNRSKPWQASVSATATRIRDYILKVKEGELIKFEIKIRVNEKRNFTYMIFQMTLQLALLLMQQN